MKGITNANKQTDDTASDLTGKVSKSGDSMSGNLNVGNNVRLSTDGGIESQYHDFHYGGGLSTDYTLRIWPDNDHSVTFTGGSGIGSVCIGTDGEGGYVNLSGASGANWWHLDCYNGGFRAVLNGSSVPFSIDSYGAATYNPGATEYSARIATTQWTKSLCGANAVYVACGTYGQGTTVTSSQGGTNGWVDFGDDWRAKTKFFMITGDVDSTNNYSWGTIYAELMTEGGSTTYHSQHFKWQGTTNSQNIPIGFLVRVSGYRYARIAMYQNNGSVTVGEDGDSERVMGLGFWYPGYDL